MQNSWFHPRPETASTGYRLVCERALAGKWAIEAALSVQHKGFGEDSRGTRNAKWAKQPSNGRGRDAIGRLSSILTYHKQFKQLAKIQLLLIDGWGLEKIAPAHRNDMMEIMDDRHGQTSTLVMSQLPTDQWYASIGDNTLADAILDRLMHNAHRIELNGESMRKKHSQLTDTGFWREQQAVFTFHH